MKLKISTIVALIGLMLFASACAGIGGGSNGMPVGLPGIESGLTEAGNPTEEETEIKGIYINTEFDVRVEYPTTWNVDRRGSEEAKFFSDNDESITAQFVWLEEGKSFDDFIIEVRGSFDGTRTMVESAFDATVCAIDDMGTPEDGMIVVECYYYNKTLRGDSVIVASGLISPESGSSAIVFSPNEGTDGKSKSAGMVIFVGGDLGDEGDADKHQGERRERPTRRKFSVRRELPRRVDRGNAAPGFGTNSWSLP
jgi:hypothetical protein